MTSKYDLLREDYTALQLAKLRQGEEINVMEANRIMRDDKENPDSLFDKAKAKHGFSIYDKAKDKISIEYLQSQVAELEQKNEDLEKKNSKLILENRQLINEKEAKELEYNRIIALHAES